MLKIIYSPHVSECGTVLLFVCSQSFKYFYCEENTVDKLPVLPVEGNYMYHPSYQR